MTEQEAPFGPDEAARRLNVTVWWLKEHRNEVPFVRIGRFRRYTQAHLDEYVRRNTVDPDAYAPSKGSKAAKARSKAS